MSPREKIVVVIPAAGIGSRMGLDLPKQFMSIDGRPVIAHTVENFLRFKGIVKVIVVASQDRLEYMQHIMNYMPPRLNLDRIKVVCGAESRHKSIYLGLKYLKNNGYENDYVVVIHDGVRPFVNHQNLYDVVTAAEQHRAAGVARNLVSTIISVDKEDMLKEALNRSSYKASEMPQAFQLAVILEGYEKCPESVMISGTECLDIVKTYADVTPKLILTDLTDAWKITYKMDLYTASHIAKEKQTVGIENGKFHQSLWYELVERLNSQFENVDSDCSFKTLCYSNYIIFHSKKTISDVIDADDHTPVSFQFKPLTIINITFDAHNCVNFQSLQKKARKVADNNLEKNITSYYIVTDFDISEHNVKKIANLITSLVFDSNRHLSGEIIFI